MFLIFTTGILVPVVEQTLFQDVAGCQGLMLWGSEQSVVCPIFTKMSVSFTFTEWGG